MQTELPYSTNTSDYHITFSPGDLLDVDNEQHELDTIAFLRAGFLYCAQFCYVTGGSRWNVFDKYESEITVRPKRRDNSK